MVVKEFNEGRLPPRARVDLAMKKRFEAFDKMVKDVWPSELRSLPEFTGRSIDLNARKTDAMKVQHDIVTPGVNELGRFIEGV